MQKYSAGKVCRILGISKETLRYYERAGLTAPERSETGYRYYTSIQIDHLTLMKMYRNMGLNSTELRDYAGSDGFSQKESAINRKIGELKLDILRKTEIIRCMEDMLGTEKLLRANAGRIYIEERPAIRYVINKLRGEYILDDEELLDVVIDWMQHMPITHPAGFYFTEDGEFSRNWGYFCTEAHAQLFGLRDAPCVHKTESSLWAVMPVILPEGQPTTKELFEQVKNDVEQNLKAKCGVAMGVSIITGTIEKGFPNRTHKIMIQIAD